MPNKAGNKGTREQGSEGAREPRILAQREDAQRGNKHERACK
jgi:hypothetical protein